MSYVPHLRQKVTNILVANVCSKSCGGCNQHCEIFNRKPQTRWFIPLKQLQDNIHTLTHPCRGPYRHNTIGLHGGDITLHPHWKKIVELMASFSQCTFNIVTKKNLGTMPKNTYVWGGPTQEDQIFSASMVAPSDYLKIERQAFWTFAQQNCIMWKNYHSLIYDNRAYLCSPAGAYDRLMGGDAGWPVRMGEDPFERSEEELRFQADNFCHRCMHCAGFHQQITQRISQPTVISRSYAVITRGLPMKAFAPFIKLL